jgi:phage terminase small subunit
MASLKNSKHEKFCQVWHETNNKSEAYRQSHPTASKWKDATVNNRASELSKQDEILGRFSELQELALKSHGITIESLLKELDEARGIALSAETPQTSSAVSATMNKAKLVGLDKHDANVKVDVTVRNTLDDFYS